MASGRLRLNRSGSQPQLPPSKCARVAHDQVPLPPLETTSHWILNDRLLGQLQDHSTDSAALLHRPTCAVDEHAAKDLPSNNSDVIVISSSQEDNSTSDPSNIIGQFKAAVDNIVPPDSATCIIHDIRIEHRAVDTVPVLSDDEGLVSSDEHFYNFGEEEEFLSQAAVVKWQEGPEAEFILDDVQHGTHCPPASLCTAPPSPAQELMAFLVRHNLDTLQPTLMAHEVVSLNCMCMLTHNDIAYATPLPLASCFLCAKNIARPGLTCSMLLRILIYSLTFSLCSTLGIMSEAVRLRLMAAIVALRRQVFARESDGGVSAQASRRFAADACHGHRSCDIPYLQLQTEPGGAALQQRDISSFFRSPLVAACSKDTDEYVTVSSFYPALAHPNLEREPLTFGACMQKFLSVGRIAHLVHAAFS